jgi:hypothetical protein
MPWSCWWSAITASKCGKTSSKWPALLARAARWTPVWVSRESAPGVFHAPCYTHCFLRGSRVRILRGASARGSGFSSAPTLQSRDPERRGSRGGAARVRAAEPSPLGSLRPRDPARAWEPSARASVAPRLRRLSAPTRRGSSGITQAAARFLLPTRGLPDKRKTGLLYDRHPLQTWRGHTFFIYWNTIIDNFLSKSSGIFIHSEIKWN